MNSHRHSQEAHEAGNPWTIRQAFLAAFFGIYFGSAILWSFPSANPAWNAFKEDYARPVLKFIGAYQNWAMFAPDPIRINRSVEARVTWKDGSSETLPFPAALHGSLIDRVRGEQFRKWSFDQIRLDRNREHWRGAAGRFARIASTDRASSDAPMIRVELIRRWSDEIQASKPETWRGDLNHQFVFYRLEGPNLQEELGR